MTIFTPKQIKQGQLLCKRAKEIIHFHQDVATPDDVQLARTLTSQLASALRDQSDQKVKELQEKLIQALNRIDPPSRRSELKDPIETLLVILVLLLGFQNYFARAFEIPTGSMQPTLNGVIGRKTDSPQPNLWIRAFQFVTRGRTYVDLTAKQDGERVLSIDPVKVSLLGNGSLITMSSHRVYRVNIPPKVLRDQLGLDVGQSFQAGQPIVRGYADEGDHLFVDKFSYNFLPPAGGNVFVFKTNGISGISPEPDGEPVPFIKRLAGIPGDTLKIREPNLFINGEPARYEGFKRVESRQAGYTGYRNDDEETGEMRYLTDPASSFAVPGGDYFALGDNSANSFDSRYWGCVPARNVIGKGFFVFWPFTSHWGLVR